MLETAAASVNRCLEPCCQDQANFLAEGHKLEPFPTIRTHSMGHIRPSVSLRRLPDAPHRAARRSLAEWTDMAHRMSPYGRKGLLQLEPSGAGLFWRVVHLRLIPPPSGYLGDIEVKNGSFPKLFSPLTVRNLTLKNRIFSTGHQAVMNVDGHPSERMIAGNVTPKTRHLFEIATSFPDKNPLLQAPPLLTSAAYLPSQEIAGNGSFRRCDSAGTCNAAKAP